MYKLAYYIFFSLVFLINTYSQEFKWKAGFYGFFDNREYYNQYSQPQSILGARTFAEGGFALDDKNEFSGGMSYMYEFGSRDNVKYLDPILYFRHKSDNIELYMGAFRRNNLINMPLVLQSDTIKYYKPNVEGIYLCFSKPWGYQKAWLDWTSRQTVDNNETFLIGISGGLNSDMTFAKYDFLLYHFAGTAQEGSFYIRDNGGLFALGGINLSKKTFLDSLSLSSGMIWSYDRLRTVYSAKHYFGSISELYAKYKLLGIRSMMYFGDGQVLMIGDNMYQSPVYNRTDLILHVLRKGKVTGIAEFSLHFIPSNADFSQKFTIYIDIGGHKLFKQ